MLTNAAVEVARLLPRGLEMKWQLHNVNEDTNFTIHTVGKIEYRSC